MTSLSEIDPEIAGYLEEERERQISGIELIASEVLLLLLFFQ